MKLKPETEAALDKLIHDEGHSVILKLIAHRVEEHADTRASAKARQVFYKAARTLFGVSVDIAGAR